MTAIANPRRPLGFGDERPALASLEAFARWVARFGALAGGTVAGVAVLALLAQSVGAVAFRSVTQGASFDLALPAITEFGALAERSIVYDSEGRQIAVLHDAVNREETTLDALPDHVWQAVLTAEDRRFFDHDGYDVEGIGRAALANVRARGITQGGSTITQQLAKVAVGTEQTYERKFEELLYAMALERRYAKHELLERYLNEVYFGTSAYGIAAAAEEYFATDASRLRVEQAALLAGLIRAPSRLDPRRDPEGAERRRNAVLDGMVDEGYLDADAAAILKALPLGVVPPRPNQISEPYIVEAVKQEFFANPAFGETREDRVKLLFSGGLEIYTTIEPELQRLGEQLVREHFPERDGVTAAIASVDPRDGRVLAAAFGRDFDAEQFNLALQGRRQPGSAFKPFVMAAALERGYPLSLTLEGRSGTTFDEDGWVEPWQVSNFANASYGRLAMNEALARSVNTAFAQLMMLVGPEAVVELTDRLGINRRAYEGVLNHSIALGGLHRGVTPLEMASAYGTFANAGVHTTPHVIARVVDDRGEVVYEADGSPVQGVSPEVNAAMVEALKGVVQRGTGTAARLPGWEVGGKTGTTQENRDVWFVGFTPVLSTTVWVGNPDERQVLFGMSSSRTAAPLWRAFMERALEGVEPVPYPDADVDYAIVRTGEPVDVPDVRRMQELEAVRTIVNLARHRRRRGVWMAPGREFWGWFC
jgi:membrane peptidoglycan carboxypeptidase